MTSLDASFTSDLSIIIYLIFVLGMIGLALSNMSCNPREDEAAPQRSQQPSDTDQNSSNVNKSVENQDHADSTHHPANGYDRKPMTDYEWRIVVLTSVIAFVTAVYTLVAGFQWDAMRLANQQTRIAFEVGQDPYVFVAEINADALKIGERVTGTVQFVNTGNLPARNFTFGGRLEIRPEYPVQIAADLLMNINEFDMPPNLSNYADQPAENLSSLFTLSAADYLAFNDGTEKLYAYGIYRYRTGFKDLNGDDEYIVQPFCRWMDNTSSQFHRCPTLNTQYKEGPRRSQNYAN
jgi:hypothetical protein